MKRTVLIGALFATASLFGAEAWDSKKSYSSPGTEVTFGGKTYKNHWWTQGDSPADYASNQWHVWRPVENSSSTTTDNTTEVPVDDNSNNQTDSSTTTNGNWDASKVYTGGMQATYNGNTYEAKWWTQGENPTQSGQWGVWKLVDGTSNTDTTDNNQGTDNSGSDNSTNTDNNATTGGGSNSDTSGTDNSNDQDYTQPDAIPLEKQDIIGYFHAWEADYLTMVNDKYTIINIAFAEPVHGQGMTMKLNVGYDKTLFKQHIKDLQAKGKKVNISIGGANAHVELNTEKDKNDFVNSMIEIIKEYNFDGLDIDLEGRSMSLEAGDLDFKNPTTPKVVNLIDAVEYINDYFDNSKDFMITAAPETFYVQVGYSVYGGSAGAYLPFLHALREELDILHVQLYNTGTVMGLDNGIYAQSTPDFSVAMSDMLLTGFNVARNGSQFFPPFREDQIALGLPADVPAAPAGGYMTPANIIKSLDYLMYNKSFGGKYVKYHSKAYDNFRGVMTWSIHWDKRNNWNFVNSMHDYFSKNHNI